MIQARSREELAKCLSRLRRSGATVGLVPTMGNLHDGHLSLLSTIREHCDAVVASIFVNPTQFGAGEDLDAYPRTPAADLRALEDGGCSLVFTPAVTAIYPDGPDLTTTVSVPGVSEGLCGSSRAGHFDGVATVVSILFNLIQPDVAIFGRKDFQQLKVIEKLVRDLGLPIRVLGAPIVREQSGLAMSSRNQYLTETQAAQAAVLHRALSALASDAATGRTSLDDAVARCAREIVEAGLKLEYLEIRNADNLKPATEMDLSLVALVAARLGSARLIDNIEFSRLVNKTVP